MEMHNTLATWFIGLGASWVISQGSFGFCLGFIVTLLTIYKILLDIQIKRKALKDLKATEVDKEDDFEEDKV